MSDLRTSVTRQGQNYLAVHTRVQTSIHSSGVRRMTKRQIRKTTSIAQCSGPSPLILGIYHVLIALQVFVSDLIVSSEKSDRNLGQKH